MYLAFNHPNQHDAVTKNTSGLEDFIVKILEALIPVGNPDFEEQLNKVERWVVEFDKEEEDTLREIGYDGRGNVSVVLPYKNNLGYWSNNNLTLEDYYKLDAKEMSVEEFQKDWDSFHAVGA